MMHVVLCHDPHCPMSRLVLSYATSCTGPYSYFYHVTIRLVLFRALYYPVAGIRAISPLMPVVPTHSLCHVRYAPTALYPTVLRRRYALSGTDYALRPFQDYLREKLDARIDEVQAVQVSPLCAYA
eukprot:1495411-Rhodomonas_salina.4